MSSSKKITLVILLVSFYMFSCVSSTEFEVGGVEGWMVPQSKTQGDMFNHWASHNRFKVGDTVRFNYTKDSVLVVSEEEYKKCKATKPQLYSNNEDTVFKLDRPGLFYFISGISGHCEKGQKMIIKVMETESSPDSPPPSSPSSSSSSSPSLPASTHKKSSALKTAVQFSSSVFVVFAVLVVSVFGLA
ncbi:early nodulin-like protein 5 [Raphanus sativus]|uniref:Early nodulin-like protein 21 n=1 Tax=Raphanus sativus TaxID=3726 RepID=A0A9W3DTA6_RAPSA|nr:early nodulin-like protein 21 [Raphanus sativus]KAJ4897853.1 early nodulin-like protein 5 [Raphanus sativus]